ncbi:MAG: molybdopterin biosynthesis protein MoeA [Synergistaceae bacterium]|jgi:putative molybdopterin biosynthesis protein|nr:molybdopterin biosynthesis protein MoeA [Synergistaceae bacterium]
MAVVESRPYPEHCSLGEAAEILLEAFAARELRIREMSPKDAVGLVFAEDITSRRNVPHYTASAVDGYAVCSKSTAVATAATPVALESGNYSWVNTGMPLTGFDAVVMVEDTSIDIDASGGSGRLIVSRGVTQGENVRAVGEDVMHGQMLACVGDAVTPALVSLLLCAGVKTVSVFERPRTLFIPTGNEIVAHNAWFSGGKIEAGFVVDSNSAYAKSLFERWGYSLDVGPILPDDPEIISEAVARGVLGYDLVIVSAGSAKGSRDHSEKIFSKLGKMLFRYVRMKPGRPAMAADINGTPVLCSPGFPMSCAVTLWSLAYPLLKMMSGERSEPAERYIKEAISSSETIKASLMSNHSSPAGMTEWLRVKCAEVEGRTLCWQMSAGASVLWALAESDGIAVLPESSLELPRGMEVTIHITRRIDLSHRLLFQGSDDPAVGLLVSMVKKSGAELVIRAVGSMGGLAALSRDDAHFAAAHLLDLSDGTYNTSYIKQFANGRNWHRKLIFHREQGIIAAPGNPKKIIGFEDLTSGDVMFENRQPGAGTRVLLDYMLAEHGLNSSDVPGYDRISITHLEAANKVASGVADAALGIKAAADALGLDFISVAQEPYELVFSERFDEHPTASALFEALDSDEWKSEVMRMGGYLMPVSG